MAQRHQRIDGQRVSRAVRSRVLIVAILTSLVAQAADLDRIRKGLEATAPALTAPADDGRPIFRVTVQGSKLEAQPWDGWSAAPTYVRPWFRGDHHEFLERVTTEKFRSATLYPVGVPVIPLVELVSKNIRQAIRRAQERRAREEVRDALAHLLACREDSAGPGCRTVQVP